MNEVPSPAQESLTTEVDEDTVLLVEMTPAPGMRQVSLTPEALAQKSTRAVDKAMGMIRAMAKRTIGTLDTLSNKPNQVELEFGIKFNTEADALIAKTGTEANIKVKMVWKRKDEPNP
ncbi:MAG: hypothetical protein F6K14_15140 [Symploca sp. SIO2C1]|nr:hypothetical protein [Symploca sp. SIO2C1]